MFRFLGLWLLWTFLSAGEDQKPHFQVDHQAGKLSIEATKESADISFENDNVDLLLKPGDVKHDITTKFVETVPIVPAVSKNDVPKKTTQDAEEGQEEIDRRKVDDSKETLDDVVKYKTNKFNASVNVGSMVAELQNQTNEKPATQYEQKASDENKDEEKHSENNEEKAEKIIKEEANKPKTENKTKTEDVRVMWKGRLNHTPEENSSVLQTLDEIKSLMSQSLRKPDSSKKKGDERFQGNSPHHSDDEYIDAANSIINTVEKQQGKPESKMSDDNPDDTYFVTQAQEILNKYKGIDRNETTSKNVAVDMEKNSATSQNKNKEPQRNGDVTYEVPKKGSSEIMKKLSNQDILRFTNDTKFETLYDNNKVSGSSDGDVTDGKALTDKSLEREEKSSFEHSNDEIVRQAANVFTNDSYHVRQHSTKEKGTASIKDEGSKQYKEGKQKELDKKQAKLERAYASFVNPAVEMVDMTEKENADQHREDTTHSNGNDVNGNLFEDKKMEDAHLSHQNSSSVAGEESQKKWKKYIYHESKDDKKNMSNQHLKKLAAWAPAITTNQDEEKEKEERYNRKKKITVDNEEKALHRMNNEDPPDNDNTDKQQKVNFREELKGEPHCNDITGCSRESLKTDNSTNKGQSMLQKQQEAEASNEAKLENVETGEYDAITQAAFDHAKELASDVARELNQTDLKMTEAHEDLVGLDTEHDDDNSNDKNVKSHHQTNETLNETTKNAELQQIKRKEEDLTLKEKQKMKNEKDWSVATSASKENVKNEKVEEDKMKIINDFVATGEGNIDDVNQRKYMKGKYPGELTKFSSIQNSGDEFRSYRNTLKNKEEENANIKNRNRKQKLKLTKEKKRLPSSNLTKKTLEKNSAKTSAKSLDNDSLKRDGVEKFLKTLGTISDDTSKQTFLKHMEKLKNPQQSNFSLLVAKKAQPPQATRQHYDRDTSQESNVSEHQEYESNLKKKNLFIVRQKKQKNDSKLLISGQKPESAGLTNDVTTAMEELEQIMKEKTYEVDKAAKEIEEDETGDVEQHITKQTPKELDLLKFKDPKHAKLFQQGPVVSLIKRKTTYADAFKDKTQSARKRNVVPAEDKNKTILKKSETVKAGEEMELYHPNQIDNNTHEKMVEKVLKKYIKASDMLKKKLYDIQKRRKEGAKFKKDVTVASIAETTADSFMSNITDLDNHQLENNLSTKASFSAATEDQEENDKKNNSVKVQSNIDQDIEGSLLTENAESTAKQLGSSSSKDVTVDDEISENKKVNLMKNTDPFQTEESYAEENDKEFSEVDKEMDKMKDALKMIKKQKHEQQNNIKEAGNEKDELPPTDVESSDNLESNTLQDQNTQDANAKNMAVKTDVSESGNLAAAKSSGEQSKETKTKTSDGDENKMAAQADNAKYKNKAADDKEKNSPSNSDDRKDVEETLNFSTKYEKSKTKESKKNSDKQNSPGTPSEDQFLYELNIERKKMAQQNNKPDEKGASSHLHKGITVKPKESQFEGKNIDKLKQSLSTTEETQGLRKSSSSERGQHDSKMKALKKSAGQEQSVEESSINSTESDLSYLDEEGDAKKKESGEEMMNKTKKESGEEMMNKTKKESGEEMMNKTKKGQNKGDVKELSHSTNSQANEAYEEETHATDSSHKYHKSSEQNSNQQIANVERKQSVATDMHQDDDSAKKRKKKKEAQQILQDMAQLMKSEDFITDKSGTPYSPASKNVSKKEFTNERDFNTVEEVKHKKDNASKNITDDNSTLDHLSGNMTRTELMEMFSNTSKNETEVDNKLLDAANSAIFNTSKLFTKDSESADIKPKPQTEQKAVAAAQQTVVDPYTTIKRSFIKLRRNNTFKGT